MKRTKLQQIIREEIQIVLNEIKIGKETGSFKLDNNKRKVLSRIFLNSIKGSEDKIKRPQFFESGYSGIVFYINNVKYFLLYSGGKVGLEDQSMGSLSLQKGGTVIFSVGPDYYKRGFGDTDIDKNHEKVFTQKLKTFIKSRK